MTKGDILKRYQAYKTGLECNVLQIDEARYKEDLPPLGLNWIKLGLQDVLYDPKTKRIYTPNMNQSMQMTEKPLNLSENTVDKSAQGGIIEERKAVFGEGHRIVGNVPDGTGGDSGSAGGGKNGSGGAKSSSNGENNNSSESDFITKDFSKMTDMKEKMSDIDVRKWYDYHDRHIGEKIDKTKTVGEQAHQAHKLRNTYKFQARELMADQEKRKYLDENFPLREFDYYFTKYRPQCKNDDEAYKMIIDSSMRPNKKVNKKFGLE